MPVTDTGRAGAIAIRTSDTGAVIQVSIPMTRHLHSRTCAVSLAALAFLLAACGGGSGGDAAGSGPAAIPQVLGAGEWLIARADVVDGGPGVEGIPAIDRPVFESASVNDRVNPTDLVVGIRFGGAVKAYPHDILDWHEIVNDGPANNPFSLSYCPLTGSAVAWKGNESGADPTFGVSGMLYNSNLILLDRETSSLWSQMLEQSVNGSRIREFPDRIQVIETTWETWRRMYPGSVVLTTDTGHARSYGTYPYGSYRTGRMLLFPVTSTDDRLHPKTRVIGIRAGTASKVYQIDGFASSMQAINDQVGDQSIVVVGNSQLQVAAIYNRQLADGTILNFTGIDDSLPNVMRDDEGNVWDIFGTAASGPRAGTQLGMTASYVSMWFAWAAFFPDTEIHFN